MHAGLTLGVDWQIRTHSVRFSLLRMQSYIVYIWHVRAPLLIGRFSDFQDSVWPWSVIRSTNGRKIGKSPEIRCFLESEWAFWGMRPSFWRTPAWRCLLRLRFAHQKHEATEVVHHVFHLEFRLCAPQSDPPMECATHIMLDSTKDMLDSGACFGEYAIDFLA